MEPYRADRVVRTLAALVAVPYYAMWLVVVLVVVLTPLQMMAGEATRLEVPVRVDTPEGTLITDWDPAERRFTLDEVQGELDVPMGVAPLWLRVTSWLVQVGLAGLTLRFVYHLRHVFVRVRDGAPFDARNALRMRSLGMLLLVMNLLDTAYDFFMGVVVTQSLDARSSIDLGAGLELDGGHIFMAFVLIALAEIFRRGSQLEDEQSLVV